MERDSEDHGIEFERFVVISTGSDNKVVVRTRAFWSMDTFVCLGSHHDSGPVATASGSCSNMVRTDFGIWGGIQ